MHLAWRDILHEGPVPAGASLEETSAVRAQFLGLNGFGNAIRLGRDFQKRDRTIAKAGEYEEVVLWFEHDLYDQLQLLQILHYLATQSLPLGKVQLIQTDDFLGNLMPEELVPLQTKRRPVNAATFKLASQVWDAFRAPVPQPLYEMHNHVTSEMRHLHGAIRRLFEEYPAVRTGLSRTQSQILDTVAEGAHRRDDIFRLSQMREEASFLGDTPFFSILDTLAGTSAPVLEQTQTGYALTPLGRRVHAGESDWLETHAIHRWIGGVHLTAGDVWRWDAAARAFSR
ncbi:MAG: DUF1835 domain-containing protein [Candidatus Eremiobacteraeota bacterium]|nr:DUF1835 domain-containing protein [Candidatus Eremiobacteraeota bacterium]